MRFLPDSLIVHKCTKWRLGHERPYNRQVRLVVQPRDTASRAFALVTEQVTAPGKGEILMRNRYLSVDPAQRGWANDEGYYSAPVPLDTPMRALAVGEVLESNTAEVRAGEFACG
jgi:NADPH-dependent curcumin reductase